MKRRSQQAVNSILDFVEKGEIEKAILAGRDSEDFVAKTMVYSSEEIIFQRVFTSRKSGVKALQPGSARAGYHHNTGAIAGIAWDCHGDDPCFRSAWTNGIGSSRRNYRRYR